MRKTQIIPYKESDFKETNGDRIRNMTDQELAKMFARIGERCRKQSHCQSCPLNNGCNYDGISTPFEIWLKQEANEDAEESL